MLANVPRNVLLFLLVSAFIIAVVVIVCGTIYVISSARKTKSPNKKKVLFISMFAIVIAAISWITNLGWIRIIMTFMLIPFVHAVIFFLTNLYVSSYVEKSKNINLLNLMFCITYLLLYIFLPDGADYGEMYFFFGLIHSDWLSSVAQIVSSIAFLSHVTLFVLQIVHVGKIKRR